jgi:alkylated DNA repair dioxygenase AlkB
MQPRSFEVDAPENFHYRPDFLDIPEEQALLDEIRRMEASEVELRGVVARRRAAHDGWTYGYAARTSEPGAPIPACLLPARSRAATWLGVDAAAPAEARVTEYPPGAPIGWHRDAPMFGDVLGISLGSPCRMEFRPYVSPRDLGRSGRSPRRATHEVELAPRSAYLITSRARREFEHHIRPVDAMRYSITFRTMVRRRNR